MNYVIVFGGSGFLGSSLVEKLIDENIELKLMIHSKETHHNCFKFQGDICNKESFDNQIKDDSIVVNFIGQYDDSISHFIDLNIKGGLNLLESCLKKKNVKIILISSVSVYGNNILKPSKETDEPKPQTKYGQIKLLTEQLYQNYSISNGLDITILRLANIFGPKKKNGLILNMMNAIQNNKVVTIDQNGTQQRDYLFLDDAVNGILNSIRKPQRGFKIFNISSGKRYTTKEVKSKIEKIFQKKLKIKFIKKIQNEKCIWADSTKAKKILKFTPKIDLETGLQKTKINLND